jgi:urease accessory protein
MLNDTTQGKHMIRILLLGLGCITAPSAFAHTFGAHGMGLVAGLSHPLLGLDHLLAMTAVGLWAAQLGGQALWRIPLAFVTSMAAGALLGAYGLTLPGVEAGIAVSVLLLGLLIAAAARLPIAAGMGLVALFALFHGHAHGLEMPQAAAPWGYGLGMLLSTALLHGLGVLAGIKVRQNFLRLAGPAISLAGLGLVISHMA